MPHRRCLSYILGLESSADDTCVAIISSQPRILSNVVLRQDHEAYGGIYPLKASHWHTQRFPLAIRAALNEAKIRLEDVTAVAYTRGPGLGPCLSACSLVGRTLAASLGVPAIGVHHMVRGVPFDRRELMFGKQAHALTQFLTEASPARFPYLTLLVSGGHTLLILARSSNSFEILATTLDSSIGCAWLTSSTLPNSR
jgi:N6-L-threonylcarbamoyladenine synthase